jgi:hypothetical protein
MAVEEMNGYVVGQYGWIEVLDAAGERWHWVQGEIVRLIPGAEEAPWALIRTRLGTVLCRLG